MHQCFHTVSQSDHAGLVVTASQQIQQSSRFSVALGNFLVGRLTLAKICIQHTKVDTANDVRCQGHSAGGHIHHVVKVTVVTGQATSIRGQTSQSSQQIFEGFSPLYASHVAKYTVLKLEMMSTPIDQPGASPVFPCSKEDSPTYTPQLTEPASQNGRVKKVKCNSNSKTV